MLITNTIIIYPSINNKWITIYLPPDGNSQSNGGEFVISMQIRKLTLTRSTRINKHLFKFPSQ